VKKDEESLEREGGRCLRKTRTYRLDSASLVRANEEEDLERKGGRIPRKTGTHGLGRSLILRGNEDENGLEREGV